MEYTTLSSIGMEVSRICLGCMSFGSPDWHGWVLDEAESRPIIERALDLGINFFDTANMYSRGQSERILGDVLSEYDRERQIVASKVYFPMRDDDPNSGGSPGRPSSRNSPPRSTVSGWRRSISTRRTAGTTRRPSRRPCERLTTWSVAGRSATSAPPQCMPTSSPTRSTPPTDSAPNGSPRCRTTTTSSTARRNGDAPSLRAGGHGCIPWSPLARGYLTRPHEQFDATDRPENDGWMQENPYGVGGGQEINERVEELAAEKRVSMAQLSLAWLFHQDAVNAPIVGTTSVEHLEEAVAALEISLSDSDIEYLEEPYEPLEPDRW